MTAPDYPTKPLDDMIVRNAAEEMLEVARRAHRVEVWLVMMAAALMVIIAAFTGWNTYRLRNVNRNLTDLVRSIEANQQVLQSYNEQHARTSGESHQALALNLACMSNYFYGLTVGAPQEKAVLDACFQPTTPPPPHEVLPSEKKKNGGR